MLQQRNIKRFLILIVVCVVLAGSALASAQEFFPRRFNTRVVDLSFNHYYDWKEMEEAMRKLEKAFPKFLKIKSIGKSFEGREIWYMTINNPDTGEEMDKCAFYMDANIHSLEVQGGEVGLYTIWYLMENYKHNNYIRDLVDERVFYIFPAVNPDGRDAWLHLDGAARSGNVPMDSDNDGLYDEDPPEDLDGDGETGSMFIKVELGKGTHRLNDKGDELVPIQTNIPYKEDEKGDYLSVGSEGIDNDGDGRYNEDGFGGYDANRDWPSYWQPSYIQGGAGNYPFSWPESKATRDFFYSHPNIAGVQAFHNTGAMILRNPGVALHGEMMPGDLAVMDDIGKKGERIIEGYDYIIIWKDLYSVWGGFIDYTLDMLGIYSFSNELWTSRSDLDGDGQITQEEREFFDHYIDLDNKTIPMHTIDHPQLGEVIINKGDSRLFSRSPPFWLLEEMLHRNMAFCLLHADEMPMPTIKSVSSEKISGNLHRVKVSLFNKRLMPTLSQAAIANKVQRPDILSIDGDVKVLAVGQSAGSGMPAGIPRQFRRFFRGGGSSPDAVTFIDQKDLKNLKLMNGVPSRGEVIYHFLVEGKGNITIKLDCVKGGTHTTTYNLK